ncbi:hypothetical protein LLG96_15450 [bacterium]|nr:hypothetical protein [bacterium]
MNLLLRIMQIYIPTFIKKRKIEELFNCTALAFECNIPQVDGLSFDECLEMYALFTKEVVERSIQQGNDMQIIKKRLYQNAFRLGEQIRKRFHVTTIEEVMTMSRILYRALKIEFHMTVQRDVTIKRCFFSRFYSSQVCQVISSLDEGVIAGLSGGGKLIFSGRITEGKDCCKACLVLQDLPI